MEWIDTLFVEHTALQAVVVVALICAAGMALGKVRIGGISLPEGCAIGALIRGNDENALVLMGDKDTVIEAEDHVIVFVPSKKLIPKIERLFTVNVGFF